jgi:ELWxxDGT repeat protein
MSKKLPLKKFAPAVGAIKRFARVSALCFSIFLNSFSLLGQAQLLADIDESEELTYNEYSRLTDGTGRLYFVVHGKELWTSYPHDGGAEHTQYLKTFSGISNLVLSGTTLFFAADDGASGAELWKSNGTEEGTVRVKDIRTGSTGSSPELLTDVNGTLYFVANNGTNGKEVWKSNGTASGTVLVKDVFPKGGSSNPASLTNVNGALYFAANDGSHGYELWKSNGTAEGTVLVKDIRPEVRISSSPDKFVNVNGILFFVATYPPLGRELWKSDGTEAGTVLVKDVRSGTGTSSIDNGVAVNNILLFTASDGVHGQELWKSDGTEGGTVLVKDMTPGSPGSHGEQAFSFKMGNFTNINGILYYTAYEYDTYYIWRSDGTTSGTRRIQLCKGPGIAQPYTKFTLYNNRIYYFNRTGASYDPLGLWSMDLNGGDHQPFLEFIQQDAYQTYVPEMVKVASFLYISGRSDGWYGFKIVRTDGTYENTVWLQDASTFTEGSNPGEFINYNNTVYFKANDSFYEQDALWVTDGTPQGTRGVADYNQYMGELEIVGNNLFASALGSFEIFVTDLTSRNTESLIHDYNKGPAKSLISYNGNLYFTNDDGELWTSDGTAAGTKMMKDFYQIRAMNVVGGWLIFRVLHNDLTEELWRTNGTLAGTIKFKTLHTGNVKFSLHYPTATIGSTLYFISNDGVHGNEVWKTRGTLASTVMVTDLNQQEDPSHYEEYDIRNLGVLRDNLYISAKDQNGEWALFKTNGTSAGTVKVVNMQPVAQMVAGSDKLFLFVTTGTYGEYVDLWTTDGTSGGTHVTTELNSPYGGVEYEFINDVLYFSTLREGDLWRSDGTACGTFRSDITGGASPIAKINTTLIFGSYQPQTGYEPYAYDPTGENAPCEEFVAEAEGAAAGNLTTQEEKILTAYPNPFAGDFVFRLEGADDDFADVNVFTLTGKPVENIGNVKANTDHPAGRSWPPGIYVVKVNRGGKLTTHMVVKK